MITIGINIFKESDKTQQDIFLAVICLKNSSTGETLIFPSGEGMSLKEANQKALESLLSMQKDLANTIDLVKKEIEKE